MFESVSQSLKVNCGQLRRAKSLTTPRFPTRGYWFSVSNAYNIADIHPWLAFKSNKYKRLVGFYKSHFFFKFKFYNRLKKPNK